MEIVPSLAAREKDPSAISMCAISTHAILTDIESFYQMESRRNNIKVYNNLNILLLPRMYCILSFTTKFYSNDLLATCIMSSMFTMHHYIILIVRFENLHQTYPLC